MIQGPAIDQRLQKRLGGKRLGRGFWARPVRMVSNCKPTSTRLATARSPPNQFVRPVQCTRLLQAQYGASLVASVLASTLTSYVRTEKKAESWPTENGVAASLDSSNGHRRAM